MPASGSGLDPILEVVGILLFAVAVAGLVGLREALLFAFRILEETALPALDVLVVDAELFHLGHGIVVKLVHFRSPGSVVDEG
ncbi:hypothetical protein THIOKS11770020 [Thiocapsa sp. KS1]|nr:hypothetical protein THIOKS11770020 [Thiocapsa sp. KS1]